MAAKRRRGTPGLKLTHYRIAALPDLGRALKWLGAGKQIEEINQLGRALVHQVEGHVQAVLAVVHDRIAGAGRAV